MARCRFPRKQKYPSLKAAKKALRHMPPYYSVVNFPYKCGDHWHVGRDAWKHIDRALARAR